MTRSSEAGNPLDHTLEQAVDSRAYAFAYLIKEPSQLPADFPVDEDFQQALFLPQELVPRFKVPRYLPRILIQQPDRVVVYSHPKCGLAKTIIAFIDISYLELERFLTDCSLTIITAGTAGMSGLVSIFFLSRALEGLRAAAVTPPCLRTSRRSLSTALVCAPKR